MLNYTPRPEPETPYDVIVVAQEYDGWADFPDRPWNLLATLNAIAGSGLIPGFPSLHNATVSVDLGQAGTEDERHDHRELHRWRHDDVSRAEPGPAAAATAA